MEEIWRFTEDIEGVNRLLSEWGGGFAGVEGITVSHRALILVLRDFVQDSELVVGCGDPDAYCGPLRWMQCQLAAERLFGGNVVLVDRAAGVKVQCGRIQAFERKRSYPHPHSP